MKRSLATASLAILLLAVATSGTAHPSHYAKTHDGILLPDPQTTPGRIAIQDKSIVCATQWGMDARHVTEAMKDQVYANYGVAKREGICCEVDHLVPRDLGGADHMANLWPQPWNQARMKDRVEVWLNRQVCSESISLSAAQSAIARNWVNVYREMLRQRGG